MNILISNDDGIEAVGIKALAGRLEDRHTVFVVAPAHEQSATSHSLTLRRNLSARPIKERWFAVDGTPADCVNLAVNGILDIRPDIVVSGINHGANLGDDIFYSGTVSAAVEGMFLGIPAVAVSFEMKKGSDFTPAADFAGHLVDYIEKNGMPTGIVLNVNIPDVVTKETPPYRVTKQGKRMYGNSIAVRIPSSDSNEYMIGDAHVDYVQDIESDFFAMTHGYISITPLHFDLTDYALIKEMNTWKIEIPTR